MLKLAQVSMLAIAVGFTTAATPFVAPAVSHAIIEGGTVSTLPKTVKARGGKVIVLRGRADKPAPAKARPAAARGGKQQSAATPSTRKRAGDESRAVACTTGTVSTGGSASDVVELRNTETGLRVVIIGPDGLARTRYVPAPPGTTARHSQDD